MILLFPANKRVFLELIQTVLLVVKVLTILDIMPTKFKEKIAEKAARVFDAKICGVDIIIDDMEKDSILLSEINDNLDILLMSSLMRVEEKKIGVAILKLLNFDGIGYNIECRRLGGTYYIRGPL